MVPMVPSSEWARLRAGVAWCRAQKGGPRLGCSDFWLDEVTFEPSGTGSGSFLPVHVAILQRFFSGWQQLVPGRPTALCVVSVVQRHPHRTPYVLLRPHLLGNPHFLGPHVFPVAQFPLLPGVLGGWDLVPDRDVLSLLAAGF